MAHAFHCPDKQMKEQLNQGKWSENVIIADADYIDSVAFHLIVNFERMIGRRIPPADMARWIDCIALDGGVREGENEIQVVLIHDKEKVKMANFVPAEYAGELSGKAFKDHLGEFVVDSYPVEEMTTKDDFLFDVLAMVAAEKNVQRIMVVPNAEEGDIYDRIRQHLRHVGERKNVTVFAMQPMPGGNFKQEILGYSLMQALGIRADEIK